MTSKADTIATKQLMQQNAAKKHKNDNKEASDQKARVTLGVIMGTFLLCWLPFFCANIITSFTHFPPALFVTFTWCGYANSSANPIIYSIFNRDFRRAFHRILLKCCEVCSCCAKCCKARLQQGNTAKRSWRGGPAARYQAGTPAASAALAGGNAKPPGLVARFSKKTARNGTRSGGIRVEDGDEEDDVTKPMAPNHQQPLSAQSNATPAPTLPSCCTTAVTINNVGTSENVVDGDTSHSHSSQSPNCSTHRFKPVEVVATV